MNALLWVDGLLAEFCSSFAGSLREEARRLPFTLGLAREPFVPWSRVFNHEVTLAAPAMVAEAMPDVPAEAVRHALFGHALAVIEAMGTDRIEDGQVVETAGLRKVLWAARAVRDEELLLAAGDRGALDPAAVDAEFREAMRGEREILLEGRGVDFALYEAISRRKQVCGTLGVDALAVRAGWCARERRVLREAVLGVALGLQLHDDVVDWEDDAARGRSWALALVLGATPGPRALVSAVDVRSWRGRVLEAGVLARMLRRSRRHFRGGARRARAVGAHRLSRWAQERVELLSQLGD